MTDYTKSIWNPTALSPDYAEYSRHIERDVKIDRLAKKGGLWFSIAFFVVLWAIIDLRSIVMLELNHLHPYISGMIFGILAYLCWRVYVRFSTISKLKATRDIEKHRWEARSVTLYSKLSVEQTEWPFSERLSGRNSDSFIMMRDGADSVRILSLKFNSHGELDSEDYLIPLASIISVTTDQKTSTVASVRKEEQVITKPGRQKSTIGRAVVGGLTLGPVGAVVGAVSALPPSASKTETKTIYVPEQKDVKDAPELVIAIRDMKTPTRRFTFAKLEQAELWRSRIEIARSMEPQSGT